MVIKQKMRSDNLKSTILPISTKSSCSNTHPTLEAGTAVAVVAVSLQTDTVVVVVVVEVEGMEKWCSWRSTHNWDGLVTVVTDVYPTAMVVRWW